MTEAEWLAAIEPTRMLKFLEDKVSERKLRLLACAASLRLTAEDWVYGPIGVAEAYSDGVVGEAELEEARNGVMANVGDYEGHLSSVDLKCFEAVCSTPTMRSVLAVLQYAADGVATIEAVHPGCGSYVIDKGEFRSQLMEQEKAQAALIRDIFGNPFRPVTISPSWLTSTVHALATGIYAEKAFDRLPILADALQDAGCDNDDMLNHCRQPGEHVKGCWVVDRLLGKE